jgi:hypothetical protein
MVFVEILLVQMKTLFELNFALQLRHRTKNDLAPTLFCRPDRGDSLGESVAILNVINLLQNVINLLQYQHFNGQTTSI